MQSEDIRGLLSSLASRISGDLVGIDRQKAVERMLGGLTSHETDAMRGALHLLLGQMAIREASDLDLGGAGCKGHIWYRVHGEKRPDETWGTFTEDETDLFCQSMLADTQRAYLFANRNIDFSYTVTENGRTLRFRADLYFELDHLALNVRHIPNRIRPFKELELPPAVVRTLVMAYDKQGLALVTGVTGSGKSTTLDSIVDANNQTWDGHIVIIGAPIETIHTSKRCLVRHREVGRDVASFKDGTIQALRQDPDIIVVGEMRDSETIDTALEVTDSGHKIFSTLHTASAVESIDRIIAECPPLEQNRVRERLADTLKCIISQKLVPSLDGKRVLAKEILLVTPSVAAAIKNDNTDEIYQMMREGRSNGMNTMEQDLKRLVDSRRISPQEATSYANNRRRLEELL